LLLGITTPLYPIYSSTYLSSLTRLIKTNHPRVVLAESADAADQQLYINVCELLLKHGYTKVKAGSYDAKLQRASLRHYSLWLKIWDYDRWRTIFWNKNINDAYEQFYQAAGIGLQPIQIKDNRKPTLTKNKDRILRDLILKRSGISSILVVGFWNAVFSYHMGMHGYFIHGIEPYVNAVTVARQTQNTLPPELAGQFKFDVGYAEDLSGLPMYDATVNFCLEHVRDPQLVVSEALKHTKTVAYFTPPIGRGCDSPAHLYHFKEADIRELIPDGWEPVFHRVKFLKNSPYPNCFIVEVTKKQKAL